MILHDYHIHTDFSCDCSVSMVDVCRAAVDQGIPEIGIAEHLDLVPEDVGYASFQVEAWWKKLESCRETFRDVLTIRAGVETGEPHRFVSTIRDALGRFPWDYRTGALHWVGPTLIWNEGYYRRPAEEAYCDYFHELAQAAAVGDFEILAHMDIVKRYGFDYYGAYDPRKYEPEIREVLRICASKGMALEVNSATLRRPIAELCPEGIVVSWFRQEGGQWVTLGSDAHLAKDVGFGLERATAVVQEAGFDYLARFEACKPYPVTISKSRSTP